MVNPNPEDPLFPEIATKYAENKINILKQPPFLKVFSMATLSQAMD